MKQFILVFIGGGLGSVARYATARFSWLIYKGEFPLGTLLSNLLSCTILAFFILYFQEKFIDSWWKLLIVTGFCGGYSTFSAYSYESVALFKSGHTFLFAANILTNLIFGFLLIYLLISKSP